MRNLKKFTLAACMLLICGSAFAQKLGVINTQELIETMPEYTEALTNMEAFNVTLQEQLDILTGEYTTKYQEYASTEATMAASVKEIKQQELSGIQARIEQFQQTAQQDSQNKYRELLEPVINKAQASVDKVAKANGFAIIFDLSTGATPYVDETTVTNILSLVKADLGIAN